MWSFYFPHEKLGGMVYQDILGIPMGTNCAPLVVDLFLFCYETDFMSHSHKSKPYDLKGMFNNTSRYFDDIFTIDKPKFDKHIPDLYQANLQVNKANTSDKETSLFEINIKVIGSDVHTSVKASAHSFKRFTSRLLKLSFSLYAHITSDECHAWFHLNAASPAARNTEQVNITKKSCSR